MKNVLIFLTGAIIGAGVGIFAYKKYAEWKNGEGDEDYIVEPESEPVSDGTIIEAEPEEKTFVKAPVTELSDDPNDYSACFTRYNQLKEHDKELKARTENKEVSAMNNRPRFEVIEEDDYHQCNYSMYTYELNIETRELFDYEGDLIPKSEWGKLFGDENIDRIVNTLCGDNTPDCIYVRDNDNEEDNEIIAVLG